MEQTTLLSTIRDTTLVTDELVTLMQWVNMLESIVAGDSDFSQLYQKIREKVIYIKSSMESIQSDGINQQLVQTLEIQLPGIL